MKLRLLLVGLVAGGALAAAGGAAVNANVVGSYTAKVTNQAPKLNGRWTLKFTTTYAPAGTFQSFRNGKLVVSGTTAFTGNKVTFIDMKGSYACKGTQQTGIYSYTLKGKALRLTNVVDLCAGRSLLLSSRTFTKK